MEADEIVRRRMRPVWAAAWVMAVTVAMTACATGLRDLGPLPPRSSGPPLPTDTVVSELTSALAAEGVTLKRTPQEQIVLECQEVLTGEHAAATADAALKAGVARARADHGWRTGPRQGSGSLSLRKGNWTAAATLSGPGSAGSPTALILITLLCDGSRAKRTADSTPSTPSTPSTR